MKGEVMGKYLWCSVVLSMCLMTSVNAEGGGAREKIWIRGVVVTPEGVPAEGVRVECWYLDKRDFPWEFGRCVCDKEGRYEFRVPRGYKYHVEAGGKKATFAKSLTYMAEAGMDISVEDLVVRLADGCLKGRVVKSDGSGAGGMLYACRSESFRPFSRPDYPKTDANGRFHIPNVLADEEASFWVVPLPNKAQIWMGIQPNSRDLLLRLDPKRFIDLPPGWKGYGYIESVVRGMSRTKVKERIRFDIADLEGDVISLDSDRFKGEVVLVNIFGTWCGSCRGETPELVKMKKKYGKRGLEIIGIAFERDPEASAREKVRRWIEKHKINYPVLFGGQEKRTHVLETIKGIERFSGYPTNIFIGRDGKVKDVKVNFLTFKEDVRKWQVARFEEIIVGLLKESIKN
ncbi:MAG: redoxin family protein [Phycisphaerae bacterium]|nr:redoxin family protein [Phycisphaerae bacterium]